MYAWAALPDLVDICVFAGLALSSAIPSLARASRFPSGLRPNANRLHKSLQESATGGPDWYPSSAVRAVEEQPVEIIATKNAL
jgi:hypothetical protein